MALDSKKQQVWLVTATPQESSDSSKTEHRHKTFIPDSFKAIVVGK